MVTILVVAWGALIVNDPYIIAALFGQVLLMITCVVGRYRKFIGFILFLVYIGGIMILIRYCVILIPSYKFGLTPIVPLVIGVALSKGEKYWGGSFMYGLLFRARAVFLIALLLYLVMLAIVEVIGYSDGIIKL